ncbi:MAG: hypothetical protein HRT37_24065 [Alteromonadaceae bacterium]|nr:hypothetical protein [Alteromonadaceae bacterium]
MNTKQQERQLFGPSVRLEEMLSKNPNFKDIGKGLAKEIELITNFSYATARKWLFEDALPRTADERVRVAKILAIDLMYWEYGFTDPSKTVEVFKDNYLLHMKIANKVMEIIHKKEVDIASEKIIEIELLLIDIANKTNNADPDMKIIESLISLAS